MTFLKMMMLRQMMLAAAGYTRLQMQPPAQPQNQKSDDSATPQQPNPLQST